MLLAVVAWPAALGHGTISKVGTAGSHAVAWRISFGTQTVGFLKLAIFGLRAIEHTARAVAIATEMIAVHASCPSLPAALPYAQSSLPQAKAPSTLTWRVILFGSESYCQGSGPSFVLRGGGRSRKLAVALLGVHTPSKNLAPVSWIQGHIACARLKCGFDGEGIGSKLLRGWLARSKKFTSVSCHRLSQCFPRNGHGAYARRY